MAKPRAQGKKKAKTQATPAAREPFNGGYVREPDKIIDDKTGRTVLIDAIERGDLALVKKLLAAHASPNKTSKDGRAPLHYAAAAGNADIIMLLAHYGAMANPRDKYLSTPLFDALESPDPVATLRALAAIGADADIPDKSGRIPLHNAAEKMDVMVCTWLLAKTAMPDRQDSKGLSPLHLAVRDNKPAVVQAMLFERLNVMTANKDGETVLHIAAARKDGGMGVFGALLQSQAPLLVNAADINGKSPLHIAVRTKNYAMAGALIELGANVNRACKDGMTPLHEAVVAGDMKMLKLLCAEGADVNRLRAGAASSPLATAIKVWNDAAMVDFLLEAGADPSLPDANGLTPLMAAAACNNDAMINLLLGAGADASALDNNKANVLHHAGGRVMRDTLDKLVKAGADPNAREKNNGRTPLMAAVFERKPLQASWLLDVGADPKIGDSYHMTPLHLAVRYEEPSLVIKLLDKGADPNARDVHNQTSPLHIAAQMGMEREVSRLLDKGADPNIENAVGRTPLHLCLMNGLTSFEAIKHLVAKGADPLKEDKNKVTPFDYAYGNNRRPVLDLFKKHLGSRGRGYNPKKPPTPPWWEMG